jgi:hypothetical protein
LRYRPARLARPIRRLRLTTGRGVLTQISDNVLKTLAI